MILRIYFLLPRLPDCRGLEVRIDGPGSLLPLALHALLCVRDPGHHLPVALAVRHPRPHRPPAQRDSPAQKQFHAAAGHRPSGPDLIGVSGSLPRAFALLPHKLTLLPRLGTVFMDFNRINLLRTEYCYDLLRLSVYHTAILVVK